MRIITNEGEEINSAEIGDNLKLQVDVEPASKNLIFLSFIRISSNAILTFEKRSGQGLNDANSK